MDNRYIALGYHNFRMKLIFPIALIVHISMFVNSISDAIVFSYLYLIDACLCLVWFSLAVPTFTGLYRRRPNGYRWNRAFLIYMISYLSIRTVLYVSLVNNFSIGMVIVMILAIIAHVLELIYYRHRRTMFS